MLGRWASFKGHQTYRFAQGVTAILHGTRAYVVVTGAAGYLVGRNTPYDGGMMFSGNVFLLPYETGGAIAAVVNIVEEALAD